MESVEPKTSHSCCAARANFKNTRNLYFNVEEYTVRNAPFQRTTLAPLGSMLQRVCCALWISSTVVLKWRGVRSHGRYRENTGKVVALAVAAQCSAHWMFLSQCHLSVNNDAVGPTTKLQVEPKTEGVIRHYIQGTTPQWYPGNCNLNLAYIGGDLYLTAIFCNLLSFY